MATTSGGSGPPLGAHNDRTLPAWMDLEGDHGVLVILQMKTTTEGKPLPKNPFTIAKTVQQIAGKIASAHIENRGMSMALKVRSDKQAAKLKSLKQLIDGTDVVVTDHPTLNQVRCVVSCSQAIGMTEEELVNELKDQRVTAVRKFTRLVNGARQETASMVLTIQGTVKPEFVYFGFQRCEARLYIPAPMMCYNCYEYGHSKAKCGNQPVCRHCSTTHELQTNEEGKQVCDRQAFCKNCKGGHSPSAKTCPRFIEESEIAKIRTEQQISFNEARQKVAAKSASSTFANTVNQNFTPIEPRTRVQESELVKELRRELADAKKALGASSDARVEKKELAEAKKAMKEVQEARAAMKEFANIKKELDEARKAVAEVTKLRKIIQILQDQQAPKPQSILQTEDSDDEEEEDEDNSKMPPPKKEKKKKTKTKKATANPGESISPKAKKAKNDNETLGSQSNSAAQFLKVKSNKQDKRPTNKPDRSRSRSRSNTRTVESD